MNIKDSKEIMLEAFLYQIRKILVKFQLLLLFVVAGLFMSDHVVANNRQVPDSVLTKLMKFPESISSYSVDELTADMNINRIKTWTRIISSLEATGISRTIIKQYYFPLCNRIIKSYYDTTDLLREMAIERGFPTERIVRLDSLCSGRNIVNRFNEYQQTIIAIQGLPDENLFLHAFYGNMRMIEHFIWGNNEYMDKIDPIPSKLVKNISDLFGVDTLFFEKDFVSLLQSKNNHVVFLVENAAIFIEASTYLNQHQMGMVCGVVFPAFAAQHNKHGFTDVLDIVYSKRWGNLWDKMKPIITYQWLGLVGDKGSTFHSYRDSLLSQNIEIGNYLPNQCTEDMRKNPYFEEYNNKFYDALDWVFCSFVKNNYASNFSPVGSQLFNSYGCTNLNDFLILYTNETLRRYYDMNDFKVWGKIEGIKNYLENTSEYPADVALHIVECYAPINAIKARDFIRRTSLSTWLDSQMVAPQEEYNDLAFRTAATFSYVYASLLNEARYPIILKYIEWIKNNFNNILEDKDGIVYNVASALTLMEDYKESNTWISKISVDDSEFAQEFYRLLLENYYALGKYREVIEVASNLKSISYTDILRTFYAKLDEHDKDGLGDLLSAYTASLSYDFNLFPFMEDKDKESALQLARYKVTDLITILEISLWVKSETGERAGDAFRPYVAAIVYNWALASKGALLRSNRYVQEMVLGKMSPEDYGYYQQALAYDEEDTQREGIEDVVDCVVADMAKAVLLEYVRNNPNELFPQFDYTLVQNQLQVGDIAIELVGRGDDLYDVAMIRSDWTYPQFFGIMRSGKTDNCALLWTQLKPYLNGVKRIYISLDGEYNFDNFESSIDSTGVAMADKYKIYRVFSTLNIPNDVYLSDIQQVAIYGNLKYADTDEQFEYNVNIAEKSVHTVAAHDAVRGNITTRWHELSATAEELQSIVEIMSYNNVLCKPYQGEEGDKASFMALNKEHINLLHLATHGFYEDKIYQGGESISAMKRSGIVLAKSGYDMFYKKDSGSVFANEIANMDLNSVKLLILSACDTAKGDLGEDGVFGLQRAFKQAGVGCIIMSLGKVNSIMTTDLMQVFYSCFAKGQSVREAFRNAQKQIALKYQIDDWKYFVIID